jgi:hypothetical protein
VSQAVDYASLIDRPQAATILLLSLHFDREIKGIDLKITQEAFLFIHHAEKKQRQLGLLWREVYAAEDLQSDSTALKSAGEGLARCFNCAEHLDTLNNNGDTTPCAMVPNNAAIDNNQVVYKIFDNRFHPTYRKLDAWLPQRSGDAAPRPWLDPLYVDSEFLLFEESDTADELGRPFSCATSKCMDPA